MMVSLPLAEVMHGSDIEVLTEMTDTEFAILLVLLLDKIHDVSSELIFGVSCLSTVGVSGSSMYAMAKSKDDPGDDSGAGGGGWGGGVGVRLPLEDSVPDENGMATGGAGGGGRRFLA